MLIKTRFKGLFLIKNKKFKDRRGYFKEILKEKNHKYPNQKLLILLDY